MARARLLNAAYRRVLRKLYTFRIQTEESPDKNKLQRIATLIEDADRVYFFGISSSDRARDMKLRFVRLGVVCEALFDQEMVFRLDNQYF